MCVGEEFLALDVLSNTEAVPKLFGQLICCAPIIFKNLIIRGCHVLPAILNLKSVLIIRKHTLAELLKIIYKQINFVFVHYRLDNTTFNKIYKVNK
jgi:hypothetical protein